jgi:hypothetical protein
LANWLVSSQYNHELKLDRAREHLQSLHAEVREWLKGDTYRYVPKLDFDGGKKRIHFEVLQVPPARFSLIIGDCLHNLRSALDSLIYELAIAYTGIDPLPEDRARELGFPIFGPKPLKPGKSREMIGCIHPEAQTVIKELQPHLRGKKEYATSPLWQLHRLSNVDKHRLPHTTLHASIGGAYFPDAPGLPTDLSVNIGPTKDGAEVASYTPAVGESPSEVNMQFNITRSIAFGQQSEVAGEPVLMTLQLMEWFISRKVVWPLIPFLTPH